MPERTHTVAVDFDGVLHQNWQPNFERADHIANLPVVGAMRWLMDLMIRNVEIIVHSVRLSPGHPRPNESYEQYKVVKAMRSWFEEHGGDTLAHYIQFALQGKPNADVYVDDKCWRFEGIFPDAEQLLSKVSWERAFPGPEKEIRVQIRCDGAIRIRNP